MSAVEPRPAETTYSLPDIHGGQKIGLRYPVNLLGSGAQEEEQELEEQGLEEYIEDWHWDEQSHEFARQVGAFLFQFMVLIGLWINENGWSSVDGPAKGKFER